ncbi:MULTISPECIES: YlbF family regulator [Desulfosporosinus]|uniref:YlbF family regulator n=1 Tax=Desulfosporosinus nitroreducens TaxID=2018668 RepID=A0ABT8QTB5_9FIRM|nr:MULTISPECIES: YlbF family regulator [Desulfosporosinus]MCO5387237.1 YlbF family regulator [Desulfosporosinus sp.]MDA8223540.1 YlbF family regulator [Desulfitobacterium hafniense]MDO0824587.1 YlbF family regulator [Desulfosporosinus nitroreducens]
MDQVEELMQKSIELGKTIAQTDVYKEFKKAEYDLFQNGEARKLVEDLQKMKQEHRGKMMAGIVLTEAEQEELKELEQTCIRNRQVLSSNEANTRFQEFMEQISSNIKNGIKSVDK